MPFSFLSLGGTTPHLILYMDKYLIIVGYWLSLEIKTTNSFLLYTGLNSYVCSFFLLSLKSWERKEKRKEKEEKKKERKSNIKRKKEKKNKKKKKKEKREKVFNNLLTK